MTAFDGVYSAVIALILLVIIWLLLEAYDRLTKFIMKIIRFKRNGVDKMDEERRKKEVEWKQTLEDKPILDETIESWKYDNLLKAINMQSRQITDLTQQITMQHEEIKILQMEIEDLHCARQILEKQVSEISFPKSSSDKQLQEIQSRLSEL